MASSGCKPDNPYVGDCYIPPVGVNEVVNMSLPEYFRLQNLGEYITLDAGNRGIFVVHYFDDRYYALERTCTYQSDDACARVVIDTTNLQLICGAYADTGFVQCCASKYQFDGLVVSGPSVCNLKPYVVNLQDNTLFINN